MGVGLVLWVVGKRFLVQHVVDGMLPSPVKTHPRYLGCPVPINPYLHYFLRTEIPRLKEIRFFRSKLTVDTEDLLYINE
jgi:hypothetical protein